MFIGVDQINCYNQDSIGADCVEIIWRSPHLGLYYRPQRVNEDQPGLLLRSLN